ncbi:MAG: amino acid ABC transporter substrate-binding protein [Gammaproteobacteria bacterium]|nr:MAG: amino acid ABC transporter substrate-binding protein [Gammaproteobacteria bacterium]
MFKKFVMGAVTAAILVAGTLGAANAAELYGTLKKVKDTGVLNLGHREASVPFAYIGPDGKPIGYTMDLCYKIIDRVKAQISMPDLKVKLVPVTSQTRIPLLANGTIDMECGSTTNNLTRSKQIDYLAITFITGTKLLVKKGSGIKQVEDLAGKKVALSLGTTNEKAVKRVMKANNISIKILSVKDHPQAWLALESGRVDAYASDDVLLYGLISKGKNPENYEVVGRFLSYDPYGIMVRRDDSAMRLLGNTVLADLMRSGEMQKIYDKWFNPGPTKIGMPISQALQAAYAIQALPY